jgi:hypothetical protein
MGNFVGITGRHRIVSLTAMIHTADEHNPANWGMHLHSLMHRSPVALLAAPPNSMPGLDESDGHNRRSVRPTLNQVAGHKINLMTVKLYFLLLIQNSIGISISGAIYLASLQYTVN